VSCVVAGGDALEGTAANSGRLRTRNAITVTVAVAVVIVILAAVRLVQR
jgi:hypothetical protein